MSNTSNRYYVLCVKKFDFEDDARKRISGVKITYMDDTQIENTRNLKGQQVLSISSVDQSLWNQFSVVPHYYQIEFGIKPGANNKPTLFLKGARLLDQKQSV